MIGVGLTLQPDPRFLGLLDRVIRLEADYYEVVPETLWRADREGRLRDNDFLRLFAALGEATGKPFVAHGVGLSIGGGGAQDAGRRRRWLRRVAATHARLRFAWYTEHLGVTAPDGLAATLPLPLWLTGAALRTVRRRLQAMQAVVPRVGLENNVSYFLLFRPEEEAAFLRQALIGKGRHLLLDLHNLYTMAKNFDFPPRRYLEALDLRKVIEIHVSGGADSDPSWLPSGRVLRLDSHDHEVPEPVWRLLEEVLPRCPNLRGVTLERMEGTVGPADVPVLRDELRRARRLLSR